MPKQKWACFYDSVILIIDQCDSEPTRAFFATSLSRGSKPPRAAILRNQETRGATSAKGVPQNVPTPEIGLSGLDCPQQDSQPLSYSGHL